MVLLNLVAFTSDIKTGHGNTMDEIKLSVINSIYFGTNKS
jgi:hypothetical protein